MLGPVAKVAGARGASQEAAKLKNPNQPRGANSARAKIERRDKIRPDKIHGHSISMPVFLCPYRYAKVYAVRFDAKRAQINH